MSRWLLRLRLACVGLWLAGSCALPARGAETTVRPWGEYRTILWIGDSAAKYPERLPALYARLKELGINTAMVHRAEPPPALLESGLPYYVENLVSRGLCLKWNSRVRDWSGHIAGWMPQRDPQAFQREYSFDDPVWLESARAEVRKQAGIHAPHRPLAYCLRDEISVTISANPFDYDFSPAALAGFREWLEQHAYGTLDRLNRAWHTDFASWEAVVPFTTDQIKARMSGVRGAGADGAGVPVDPPRWDILEKLRFVPDEARKEAWRWNFSPWCDHRTYMDFSLARTLGALRDTAHEVDPQTPVGIEGTQMPSAFGGYDLWRLSQVLDWVEPYDLGNSREIFGSFAGGRPLLSTVGESEATAGADFARRAQRRLWHLLLEGDRGCILWWSEDVLDWNQPDLPLTARGRALAPVLRSLSSPLARLIQRAARQTDPIGIHYSQPSLQVNWLLESAVDGRTWPRRFSSYEAQHNRLAQRRQAWVKLLQDAGYTPQFVSYSRLEEGAAKSLRVLVFSDSLARSLAEFTGVQRAELTPDGPRLWLGYGPLGLFNARGSLMPGSLTLSSIQDDLPATWLCGPDGGAMTDLKELGDPVEFLRRRCEGPAKPGGVTWESKLTQHLHEILPPEVRVPADKAIRVHRYTLPQAGKAPVRLVAFERGIVWHQTEDLRQEASQAALEQPVEFVAKLAKPAHIYELRSGRYWGLSSEIEVPLSPWEPAVYALSEGKIEGDPVEGLLGGASAVR